MPTDIDKVSGIGPHAAKILAENGIVSAEDLAASQIEEVAAIKGFSTIRAEQVIAAARQLFVLQRPEGEDQTEASASKAEKLKKKKGKKDKDKKKEKKSAKEKKDKKKDKKKKKSAKKKK